MPERSPGRGAALIADTYTAGVWLASVPGAWAQSMQLWAEAASLCQWGPHAFSLCKVGKSGGTGHHKPGIFFLCLNIPYEATVILSHILFLLCFFTETSKEILFLTLIRIFGEHTSGLRNCEYKD